MSAVDLDELRQLGGDGLVFWMQRTNEPYTVLQRAYAASYLFELATMWRTSADARKRELAEAWLVEYAPERWA